MLYKAISLLLEPYVWALMLAAIGVVLVPRRPRTSFRLLVASILMLTVISLPCVEHLARWSLACHHIATPDELKMAEAIVVLGGAIVQGDGIDAAFRLAPNSLDRCRHATAVYRLRDAGAVLLSGGIMKRGWPPIAEVMRESLRHDGVPEADISVETESTTTYENALYCSRLLKQRSIRRIVLITDAICMPRASRCFQRQGIEVIASPSRYSAEEFELEWLSLIPSPKAIAGFHEVWHEWAGLAWYWLNRRI